MMMMMIVIEIFDYLLYTKDSILIIWFSEKSYEVTNLIFYKRELKIGKVK